MLENYRLNTDVKENKNALNLLFSLLTKKGIVRWILSYNSGLQFHYIMTVTFSHQLSIAKREQCTKTTLRSGLR